MQTDTLAPPALPVSPLERLLENTAKQAGSGIEKASPPKAVVVPAPLEPGPLAILDDLLRAPDRLTARLASNAHRLDTVRVLLVAMVVGAAVFGATLGIHRTLLQALFAGLKLPMITLLLAATTLPALVAFRRAARVGGDAMADAGHVLSVFALGSLVLAGTAPLPVLGVLLGVDYHPMVLLATACVAIAGLVALQRLGRLLEAQGNNLFTIAGACVVLAMVGSQVTWTLRPFIARPSVPVAFLRLDREDLIESLEKTFNSARGVFSVASVREYRERQSHRDPAPLAPVIVPAQGAARAVDVATPEEQLRAVERFDDVPVSP